MHPELFTLDLPVVGRFAVSSFGVMMGLAFLAGFWVIRRQLGERGIDEELAADLLIGAMVGGIAGAKLFYVALNAPMEPTGALEMLFSRAGLVWYGGLFGGAAGGWWAVRRHEPDLAVVADVTAPALALSYGIGRIGCLLVGDDYGQPTDAWYGIAFPNGAPPTTAGALRENFMVDIPASVPDGRVMEVIPTQPMETGLATLMFLWLWSHRDHPHGDGWLFGVWMVMAGVERFAIEFLRAKDDRFFGPFTLAQVISVALLAGGATLMWKLRSSPAETERTPSAAAGT